MTILEKVLACSRYRVTNRPTSPDFEESPYRRLPVGSKVRESSGFLPVSVGETYCTGPSTWYFRVGFDKITPCSTQVSERYRALLNGESGPVSRAKRKQLKDLAVAEIADKTPPRTKIIDGVIVDKILYLGTASNTHLGSILDHLNRIGIQAEPHAPWLDMGLDEPTDSPFDGKDPVQSAYGCDFLADLCLTDQFPYEPESGAASLFSDRGAVSCTGEVGEPVNHHLNARRLIQIKMMHQAEAEEPRPLCFDGSRFRIKSAKLPKTPKDAAEQWTLTLDFRLEQVQRLWNALDDAWDTYAAKVGLYQRKLWK